MSLNPFFSGSNGFFHQPGFTRKGLKSMLHAVCTSNTVTKFATYHIGTIGGLDLFFLPLCTRWTQSIDILQIISPDGSPSLSVFPTEVSSC